MIIQICYNSNVRIMYKIFTLYNIKSKLTSIVVEFLHILVSCMFGKKLKLIDRRFQVSHLSDTNNISLLLQYVCTKYYKTNLL